MSPYKILCVHVTAGLYMCVQARDRNTTAIYERIKYKIVICIIQLGAMINSHIEQRGGYLPPPTAAGVYHNLNYMFSSHFYRCVLCVYRGMFTRPTRIKLASRKSEQ